MKSLQSVTSWSSVLEHTFEELEKLWISKPSSRTVFEDSFRYHRRYITTASECSCSSLWTGLVRFRQSARSHGRASMAAILRSGKFLRLFSGVARNLAASSGKNDDSNGLVPQHGLPFERNFSQSNFSIQNVLPYLGVSDSGHAEDRWDDHLLHFPLKT